MGSARSEQQETDREFVERSWRRVVMCDLGDVVSMNLGGPWFDYNGFKSRQEAERSAAKFTRDRLEEIRQIEEEVNEMEIVRGSSSDWYSWVNDGPWVADDGVAPHIQRYARRSRTLARLQRELDRLKGDMKPAAPAQEQEKLHAPRN